MVNIVRKTDGRVFSYTRNRRYCGFGPSYVEPVSMTREVAQAMLARPIKDRAAFEIKAAR